MTPTITRLDSRPTVYFADDVANMLRVAVEGVYGTLEHVRPTDNGGAFLVGVNVALRTTCAAFGLRYSANAELAPDFERAFRQAANEVRDT